MTTQLRNLFVSLGLLPAVWLSVCALASAGPQGGAGSIETMERDLQRIVRDTRPSVVSVVAVWYDKTKKGKDPEAQSFASSGLVLDRAGHVITPAEPLKPGCRIFISSNAPTGRRRQFRASLVGRDPTRNIAVVKIAHPTEDLAPMQPEVTSALRLGSIVVALGCPYQFPASCSWGMVSGLDREMKTGRSRRTGLIMTTAPVNPGDAGGALVNSRGKVVGMLMSTFERTDRGEGNGKTEAGGLTASSISFVLPVDQVMRSARVILKKRGNVTPPAQRVWKFLGVRGDYLIEPNPLCALTSHLGLPKNTGFLVLELFEGEAAGRGGVRIHDILLKLGDVDIRGGQALMTAIERAQLGREVALVLLRKGKRLTVGVRFSTGSKAGKKRGDKKGRS